MRAGLVLGLLGVVACGDPVVPAPCQPTVVSVAPGTDQVAVTPGAGCVRVVRWYDEVAP